MATAIARLSIEVYVDCPHCDCMIDLTDENDTGGVHLNDDGYILSQACPNGNWCEEHKKFSVDIVECTACGNTFDVKGLEW